MVFWANQEVDLLRGKVKAMQEAYAALSNNVTAMEARADHWRLHAEKAASERDQLRTDLAAATARVAELTEANKLLAVQARNSRVESERLFSKISSARSYAEWALRSLTGACEIGTAVEPCAVSVPKEDSGA